MRIIPAKFLAPFSTSLFQFTFTKDNALPEIREDPSGVAAPAIPAFWAKGTLVFHALLGFC